MLYYLFVWATTILFLYSAGDYVIRAWKKESSPTLTTWILLNVVMGLSMIMYLNTPGSSWTANIGLTAAFVNVVLILIGVVRVAIRDNTWRLSFDKVQWACLLLAAVFVTLWLATDRPLQSYIFVQGIALIAYVATIVRQWGKKPTKPEPYFVWVSVLLANLCAIYPAVVHDDPFAMVYLLRSVPSTSFMIYVIWRKRRQLDQSTSRRSRV